MTEQLEEVKWDSMLYAPFDELRRLLPTLADALGISEDEVEVYNDRSLHWDYMYTEHRDPPVQTGGLHEMPYIVNDRLHQPSSMTPGIGWIKYQLRGNPTIEYIRLTIWYGNDGNRSVFMLCKKGNAWKIARHARNQWKKRRTDDKPILAEGMLDTIVNNTVDVMRRKRQIEAYGGKARRGIILSGKPGNGKTLACRWVQRLCAQHGITYATVTGQEIDKVYGQGGSLDYLFAKAPVTFFDDVDIGLMNRERGNGRLACSILAAMDGVNQAKHIVRVFTTNEDLTAVDPAFLRPGRIDCSFELRDPDYDMREKLVQRWHPAIQAYLGEHKRLPRLLKESEGWSFAELDAIKQIMVNNKVIVGGEWDIAKALKDFYAGRETFSAKRSVGFDLYQEDGNPDGYEEEEEYEDSGDLGAMPVEVVED